MRHLKGSDFLEKKDIASMTLEEIGAEFKSLSEPVYRAKQVYLWLRKGVTDFEEMTNLPKALRERLREFFIIKSVKIKKRLESRVDDTVKYLYELSDGELVESVLMKYHHGYSMCISSQVGCRMGCSFCASGLGGLYRNLTPSEMLAQIQVASIDRGIRVSNVVMMGMGEPLDNLENTVRFLNLVSDPDGLSIGLRHISVSTSGLVPKIYEFMEYKFPVTLSVSLHAPTDEIRDKIMKINHAYNTEKLLKACKDYIDKTGRRISFEYALIEGVNNSDECAKILAKRLSGMLCHLNLIPANPVKENDFERPADKKVQHFCELMNRLGINTTVRRTLGADIEASCGQLRQRHLESEKKGGELL